MIAALQQSTAARHSGYAQKKSQIWFVSRWNTFKDFTPNLFPLGQSGIAPTVGMFVILPNTV